MFDYIINKAINKVFKIRFFLRQKYQKLLPANFPYSARLVAVSQAHLVIHLRNGCSIIHIPIFARTIVLILMEPKGRKDVLEAE